MQPPVCGQQRAAELLRASLPGTQLPSGVSICTFVLVKQVCLMYVPGRGSILTLALRRPDLRGRGCERPELKSAGGGERTAKLVVLNTTEPQISGT